jgi:hypothetical protein
MKLNSTGRITDITTGIMPHHSSYRTTQRLNKTVTATYRASHDFDGDGAPSAVHNHQRVILAAIQTEANGMDRLLYIEFIQHFIIVIHPHLSSNKREENILA